MNKNVKGYIQHGLNKYPIGIETPMKDIYGKSLYTGDIVTIENRNIPPKETIVCTENGQIMGIFGDSKTQEGINGWVTTKIKSYKDLKDGENLASYKLKVVLDEKPKQNKVENIKHIINGNATIVILENGNKGISKCHPQDKFDKYEGFKIAYARACSSKIENNAEKSAKEYANKQIEQVDLEINEELWNDFINCKAAINCETKEDEKILFKYFYKKGIQWNGDRGIYKNWVYSYKYYKTKTCFHVENKHNNIAFSSKNYYDLENGYKIITVKELFNLIPPKQLSSYTMKELLEEVKNRLK